MVVTGMYSLFHPVLTDSASPVTSTAGVGYQVLAAASDGQLTLTEITPKLEGPDNDDDEDEDEDVKQVAVAALKDVTTTPEFCDVQASSGSLDMIVECVGST